MFYAAPPLSLSMLVAALMCETEMICRSCIAPKNVWRNGKWNEQMQKNF